MGKGVLKPAFPREDRVLRAGALRLDDLAESYGTPLYVYDAEVFLNRVEVLRDAFAGLDLLIAYSVKANGNLGILDRLRGAGCGADIVSRGELFRALRAGFDPRDIVFAGVGKTEDEIRAGLEAGIYAFNVESEAELHLIDAVAEELGVCAPFGLRVNPDIHADTPHEYTRTGHAESKFGIPLEDAIRLYQWARLRPCLRARGIDVHLGSQITTVEPYARALDTVLGIVDALATSGLELEYIDLGGGFGVGDQGQVGLPISELADTIRPRVEHRALRLILEPGRFVMGDAGVLVTRVLLVKRAGRKTFVVTDGGMTELLRPSHYGGYHAIEPVLLDPSATDPTVLVDVVGPICESGDFLARDRPLAVPEPGELLAVRTAGAYGFAMASNYNARRRPAEVLVEGEYANLVRERETLDDLVRGEHVPPAPPT